VLFPLAKNLKVSCVASLYSKFSSGLFFLSIVTFRMRLRGERVLMSAGVAIVPMVGGLLPLRLTLGAPAPFVLPVLDSVACILCVREKEREREGERER